MEVEPLPNRPIEQSASPEPVRQARRLHRQPVFEFGRLRVRDEQVHRLLLKAGAGGSY